MKGGLIVVLVLLAAVSIVVIVLHDKKGKRVVSPSRIYTQQDSVTPPTSEPETTSPTNDNVGA